jgi:DNA integrity scanning protein DisA with diadenylate cyclase activity
MIDPQAFMNLGLGIAMAVFGWFGREMWSAVKELRTDLAKLRELIARDYVTKSDYREDVQHIRDVLDNIWNAVNRKADKT